MMIYVLSNNPRMGVEFICSSLGCMGLTRLWMHELGSIKAWDRRPRLARDHLGVDTCILIPTRMITGGKNHRIYGSTIWESALDKRTTHLSEDCKTANGSY